MSNIMSETELTQKRYVRPVLGVAVDLISWRDAVDRILGWAAAGESRVVCLCNVHSLVTGRNDHAHRKALREADMVAPDGAPVAWMLRRLDVRRQERISGPDLMWRCCANAANRGIGIYLYGASQPVLLALEQRLSSSFPGLNIAGSYSPPFRSLSAEEDDLIVRRITESGAKLVWVGLGCPKQEAWMQAHKDKLGSVLIGVGAAFDFHSGTVKRAPAWMQNSGLEWFHRLAQDPVRLAHRYFVSNAVFMFSAVVELLSSRGRADRSVG